MPTTYYSDDPVTELLQRMLSLTDPVFGARSWVTVESQAAHMAAAPTTLREQVPIGDPETGLAGIIGVEFTVSAGGSPNGVFVLTDDTMVGQDINMSNIPADAIIVPIPPGSNATNKDRVVVLWSEAVTRKFACFVARDPALNTAGLIVSVRLLLNTAMGSGGTPWYGAVEVADA